MKLHFETNLDMIKLSPINPPAGSRNIASRQRAAPGWPHIGRSIVKNDHCRKERVVSDPTIGGMDHPDIDDKLDYNA